MSVIHRSHLRRSIIHRGRIIRHGDVVDGLRLLLNLLLRNVDVTRLHAHRSLFVTFFVTFLIQFDVTIVAIAIVSVGLGSLRHVAVHEVLVQIIH